MSRVVTSTSGQTFAVFNPQELPLRKGGCGCHNAFPLHASFEDGGKLHRVRICTDCQTIHDIPVELLKSVATDQKPKHDAKLESGERWITLHPDPSDPDNFVRVIIRMNSDGTGTVTRSPSGSLNYMKLTKLRSPAEWKESAKKLAHERAKIKAEKESKLSDEERDKLTESRKMVKEKEHLENQRYVSDVLTSLGQDPSSFFTPEDKLVGLPNNVKSQLQKQELSTATRQADELVQQLQQNLSAAVSFMTEDELQGVPIEALIPPAPVIGDQGSGYVACVEKKATEEGLTPTDTAKEKEDIRLRRYREKAIEKIQGEGEAATPEKIKQRITEMEANRQRLIAAMAATRQEVKAAQGSGIMSGNKVEAPAEEPDIDTVIGLVKRRQEWVRKKQELRKIKKDVENYTKPEGSALQAEDISPEDVAKDIEEKLKASSPEEQDKWLADELQLDQMQRSAYTLAGAIDDEQGANGSLGRHIGVGRYNAFNDAHQVVTGSGLFIDRATSDVLGAEGSASVIAETLRQNLSPEEFEAAKQGLTEHFKKSQQDKSDQAYARYGELMSRAQDIQIPAITNPDDLVAAQYCQDQKADLLNEARRTLGVAYGELQATAELIKALDTAKGKTEVHIPLGKVDASKAVQMARMIGLTQGESVDDDQLGALWANIDPQSVDKTRKAAEDLKAWKSQNAQADGEELSSKVASIKHGLSDGLDELQGGLADSLFDYLSGKGAPDYRLDSDGESVYLTVRPNGIDKLVQDVDSTAVQRRMEIQAIKDGKEDEPDWLPHGIMHRPLSTFEDPSQGVRTFTEPLHLNSGMNDADVRAQLEDYIGSRLADGVEPSLVRTEMTSAEFNMTHVPQGMETKYWNALNDLGFAAYSSLSTKADDELDAIADKLVRKKLASEGMEDTDVGLNAQRIDTQASYEAAHRVLAKMPEAKFAFTPIGDMTPQDKEALRLYFWHHVIHKPDPTTAKKDLEQKKEEAEKKLSEEEGGDVGQMDLFGGVTKVDRKAEAEDYKADDEHEWDRYLSAMGGTLPAYETMQEYCRGQFLSGFADELGKITGKSVRTGQSKLPHWEDHLIGLMPRQQQARILEEAQARKASEYAGLRARSGGKFAKETDDLTLQEKREALRSAVQAAQLHLFSDTGSPAQSRTTIGRTAEAQLASVFPYVSRSFDPKGGEVKLPKNLNMSEGDYVKQQRFIKLFKKEKRFANSMGVGSGKSLMSLGAFTDLHHEGKVKRALFGTPSSVQNQFGGEAGRFLEPGKYQWFAKPGAPADERRKALADPANHMVVTTHEALRDDLIWAVAQHEFGGDEDRAKEFLETAPRKIRQKTMTEAMKKQGWNFDMSVIDEGHKALNRKNKKNSALANSFDAMTDGMSYYMPMSADPAKNDTSEVWDLLRKLNPEKYNNYEDFKGKYGIDTTAAQEGLKAELSQYQYTDRIPPGVLARRQTKEVELTPAQREAYRQVDGAYRKCQLARQRGRVDVESAKLLAPKRFADAPENAHEDIARDIQDHAGLLRNRAYSRVVNDTPYEENAKFHALQEYMDKQKDGSGKTLPTIVFASEYEPVDQITSGLKKAGYTVDTFTGALSSKERSVKQKRFNGGGDKAPNVIVMTNAGSVGVNLQRAARVINWDTPDTSMTHEQRIGRMERLGQMNPDLEVLDLSTNTGYEKRRREILTNKKELRDIVTSTAGCIDDSGLAHEIYRARYGDMWRNVLDLKHRGQERQVAE